jgi:hypothetical protein
LPIPGLANDRHGLARSRIDLQLRAAQPIELGLAANELGQTLQCCGLQTGACGARSGQLIELLGLRKPFDRQQTQRARRDVLLGQSDRLLRGQDRAGRCHLLHSRSQVHSLADDRVLHVKFVADGTNHDLAGVDSDADLERGLIRLIGALRQFEHRLLHQQRGVTRAHGVILVRKWRAKDGHDAVSQHPVDGALILVDRADHFREHRVEDRLGALRVLPGYQKQRARDVREQHGHLLSFAHGVGGIQRMLDGGLDGLWSHRLRARGQIVRGALTDRLAAMRTVPGRWREFSPAACAKAYQGRSALLAEPRRRPVFVLATRTNHLDA